MTHESRTIFIADDDEEDCLIFLMALKELKYELEVVVSRDGNELMMNLNKRIPALPYVLFLDLNMPLKDGFDCLKEIRRKDKFQDLPIVILSTSRDINDIMRAYNLGANYYMPKPMNFSHLIEGIERIFQIDLSLRPQKNEFILQS